MPPRAPARGSYIPLLPSTRVPRRRIDKKKVISIFLIAILLFSALTVIAGLLAR